MNLFKKSGCILLMSLASSAFASTSEPLFSSLPGKDLNEIRKIGNNATKYVNDSMENTDQDLDSYETVLPHASTPKLSKAEAAILIAYLDNPNSATHAKINAAFNILQLQKELFISYKGKNVGAIKRAVYSLYFLHRAKKLGAKDRWIANSIKELDTFLKKSLPTSTKLDFSEQTYAQNFFLTAFTKNEADRYIAEDLLLEELLQKPTNMLTNLYVAGVTLWNGAEARYADPTMLYSYILCAYFSERAENLSKLAQERWLKSPGTNPLFRDAPTVGGFIILSRRWLAKLHDDDAVVAALDSTLFQWLPNYPEFYSWPSAVIRMHEPGNLPSAFAGYSSAIEKCTVAPSRSCGNTPRAPFNIISFQFLGMDLALKMNDRAAFDSASFIEYYPPANYDTWYLMHEPWNTRKANADSIQARYNNDNPTDDPVNAFINKQKWGTSSTCQSCHQAQGFYVSESDLFATPPRQSDDFLSIENWPSYSSTWYGDLVPAKPKK